MRIAILVTLLTTARAFAAPCLSHAPNTRPRVSPACRVRIATTALSLGLGALHLGGAIALRDAPDAPSLATVGGALAGVLGAVELGVGTGLSEAPHAGALLLSTILLPAAFAAVSGGTANAQAAFGGPGGRVTGLVAPALALVGQGVHLSWRGAHR